MLNLIFAVICLALTTVFTRKANKAVDSNNAYSAFKHGTWAGCFSTLVGVNLVYAVIVFTS